jgi:hypothetical protein
MLVIGVAVGCSSGRAAPPRPGVLPPGTAVFSVDGKDVGTTYAVRCESIDWMTTIKTKLETSGVSAMLSNANRLKAEFVGCGISEVHRFLRGELQGRRGHATGPTTTSPAPHWVSTTSSRPAQSRTFSIAVSC